MYVCVHVSIYAHTYARAHTHKCRNMKVYESSTKTGKSPPAIRALSTIGADRYAITPGWIYFDPAAYFD